MKQSRIPTVIASTIVLIVLAEAILQGASVYAESSAHSVFSRMNIQSRSSVRGAAVQNGITAGVAVSNPFSASEAKSAKDAGTTWIRTDVGIAQSVQQTYSEARSLGLNIIGVVSYWIVDNPDSFTLQDWENAIQAVQSSYPEIHVWEIWNEPTSTKYQHGYMDGTPQRYLDLMKAAYTVLKARDPTSTVLGVGGAQLGNNGDLNFTVAVFSLGGGAYMDALAIHAYPYELNEGKTWDYYKQLWLDQLKQYAQLGKPLWITETGLRSDQKSEPDQANYLNTSYSFFNAQGIRAYVWYEMRDDDVAGDFSTGSWGLLRSDLIPKQAYFTYSSLTSQPTPNLNVTPVSPTNGTAVTDNAVSVKVQVSSNGPIQDAMVTIYVNSSAACSGLSAADGYYSCSYVSKQPGLTYRWYATASKQGYTAGASTALYFTFSSQVTLTLGSKTVQGAQFSGVNVKVGNVPYVTPNSFGVSLGTHTLTAPGKVGVSGVTYNFARWEDETGASISTTPVITYNFHTAKVLYVVYAPPSYTLTVYVKIAKTTEPVSAASVFLDGTLIGKTDSRGSLVIKSVSLGAHQLTIAKDGHAKTVASLLVKTNGSYTIYL